MRYSAEVDNTVGGLGSSVDNAVDPLDVHIV